MSTSMRPRLTWLLAPISAGAFLATWGGWAKLATMTGYAEVEMFSGQSWSTFNIGIVLPMTVEPFGALAMSVAFSPSVKRWARALAGVMAVATLVAAGLCQAVVHSLTVRGAVVAPDYVVAVTSVLPVVVLGLGGALAMLNGVRVETSHETSRGTGVMGRLGQALGAVAVSRVERLAVVPETRDETPRETSRPARRETRDAPRPVRRDSTPRDETPRETRDVPAGAETFKALTPSEQGRLISEARARPEAPSYETVGKEFGISKATAHRLGTRWDVRELTIGEVSP